MFSYLFMFDIIFWLAILVGFALAVAADELTDTNSPGLNFVSLILFAVALYVSPVREYVATDYVWLAVICVPLYFLAGSFVAVVKWFLFCHDARVAFDATEDGLRLPSRFWPVSPYKKVGKDGSAGYALLVRDHKTRIVGWITSWPVVTVWFFLREPLTRLSKFTYDTLVSVLTRISNNAFK